MISGMPTCHHARRFSHQFFRSKQRAALVLAPRPCLERAALVDWDADGVAASTAHCHADPVLRI